MPCCSLDKLPPALGKQMFLQARAQTPLLLIAERLAQPLALFSGYTHFSLRDIKRKPCKTQELLTVCRLETAAASFPWAHYTQQVSAACPPPGRCASGHRKSCRPPGFPWPALWHAPRGQKEERFKK